MKQLNETPKCDKGKSKAQKISRRQENYLQNKYGDGPTPYDWGYGYNPDNAYDDVERGRNYTHKAKRNKPTKEVKRINESQLRAIVSESVKRILKEGKVLNERRVRPTFNEKQFEKWEDETHIPEKIMNVVRLVGEELGCDDSFEEQTIVVTNYYGRTMGYGKGFTLSHCTSSYADGPTPDYSKEMLSQLKGLGFEIVGSHGDNGMDSATNCRDTYWEHEFLYKPTFTDNDFLYYPDDYDPEEDEDDGYDEYDDEWQY